MKDVLLDMEDEEDIEVIQREADNYNVSAGLSTQMAKPAQSFNLEGRQLSFEVDFETFRQRFWPKVANWSRLNPLVVWTEIYSVIKGSVECYQYEYKVLPMFVYLGNQPRIKGHTEAAKFLTVQEKIMIYQIFMHYENWKQQMQAYDFMDVVNHIIKQTRDGFKQSQMIHFLMVDEVQDLTPNILWLFTNITDRNIFFCGDTA